NQGTPRGHLYILVFDQHHIAAGNEQIARRAAEKFLTTRLRPADRVAIFGLPGPGPQLGFTADVPRAVAELQKVRGSLERNARTAVGQISVNEAYEIAAGNDRVTTDVLTRQSEDLASDVGSAQQTANTPRLDRLSQRPTEDPSVSRKILQENSRTLVSQADADSRQFLQRAADLIDQYQTIEARKTFVL